MEIIEFIWKELLLPIGIISGILTYIISRNNGYPKIINEFKNKLPRKKIQAKIVDTPNI